EPISGFAIAVVREDGKWRCATLPNSALRELDAAITELRPPVPAPGARAASPAGATGGTG
ncbi:MAG TPA: hypothetical protein VE760_03655, partial [Acidimicrobiales bacterium]|nr:hypothetical protein [Acidimicrobiales bacterium]